MLEPGVIQSRGFKNVSIDGEITGFQLRIRTPYYRGIWASLLEGADVSVDDQEFSREKVLWTLGDKTLSLPELEAACNVRWPFDQAATLTVPKPGGLPVGIHDVTVKVAIRASYFPPSFGPWITHAEKRLVLAQ